MSMFSSERISGQTTSSNLEHEFDQHVGIGRKDRPGRSPEGRPGRKDRPVRSPEGCPGRKDRPVRSPEGRLGRKDRPERSPEGRPGWKDRPVRTPGLRQGLNCRPKQARARLGQGARRPENVPKPRGQIENLFIVYVLFKR